MTNKFLVLTSIAASLLAPAEYVRGRPSPSAAVRAVAQSGACRQQGVGAAPFVRTELFFGARKPDGTEVSETEWDDFLDKVVTPQFPDGLTVLTGRGQFRGSDGIVIEEKGTVLILLYPRRARKESNRKIEKIRTAYRREFRQQSVLRVDYPAPVCVSF
ncbi:MAG: DUF3574 domain-containing protein [Pyrinomonadaceae bacterium]|nr:DUF3574 domain-containing protein [Pyrinomonadaceae bacterium]